MNIGNIIYIIIIALFIIYRYQQAKKAEDNKRKSMPPDQNDEGRTDIPGAPPPRNPLTDIFREIEMKTKPYAQPSKQAQKKNIQKQPATKVPPKKAYQSISTVNYSKEATSDKGTAYELAQDTIKLGEVSNYDYNFDVAKQKPKFNFDLRTAIIANAILNRPEY